MSTNYYLHVEPCEWCHRPKKILHIGKSSAGWYFALHVTKEIKNLNDWIELFKKGKIFNEYDVYTDTEKMLDIITNRSWIHKYNLDESFNNDNYCEKGINNLIRCKIDGSHCIGHGDGTWDLIQGEFS